MISVAEAKQIIDQNTRPLGAVQLLLQLSAGMVMAEDIFATTDIPAFSQSSMDGYAFSYNGWQLNKSLRVQGEMPAGSGEIITCQPEQAVRIFTGAPVPAGADTVVMQEKVRISGHELTIMDERLVPGNNVRPVGSEIKAGDKALSKGDILSPAAVGFLAGIGVTHVAVYAKPAISLIVTGKELQQPGQPLQYGQVYESNSATLKAALQQLGINAVKVLWADDDRAMLTQVLQTALEQSDVVLLTGGVSVGDYDFVLEAAAHCGVVTLFHKIKQRPGKPLFFGRKGEQLVFGLPGNPSSVLTCFYEYVLPALQRLSNKPAGLKTIQVPLAKEIHKPAGLTHFLKGWYDSETATPLQAQESYRLSSFALANCLIRIDEDTTHCSTGELVEIHLLPA